MPSFQISYTTFEQHIKNIFISYQDRLIYLSLCLMACETRQIICVFKVLIWLYWSWKSERQIIFALHSWNSRMTLWENMKKTLHWPWYDITTRQNNGELLLSSITLTFHRSYSLVMGMWTASTSGKN